SASISQDIVNNDVAERRQPKESPKKSHPQTQLPLKSLTSSPSVFSNLVRRKSNNITPHKQRDGDPSLPKLGASPGIEVNVSSPLSDQSGKHVGN
ncbi:8230_t:CDS:2, partial [Acaulospora morrowiae]